MEGNQKVDKNSTSNAHMKTFMVLVVAGLIALVGYIFFVMGQAGNRTTVNEGTSTQEKVMPKDEMEQASDEGMMMEEAKVKEFDIAGKNFSFTPNTITVKKGDTVKVNFTNTQGTHNFIIDEFNAYTKTISTGQSDTVEFVADQTGTFEFYCSVGNHRQMGMVGTLVVE